jgi:hypothetical protein
MVEQENAGVQLSASQIRPAATRAAIRMTFFSKRKAHQPSVPKPCHRCRERIGIVRLHFTAPREVRLNDGEREAWICNECLEAVRPGQSSN